MHQVCPESMQCYNLGRYALYSTVTFKPDHADFADYDVRTAVKAIPLQIHRQHDLCVWRSYLCMVKISTFVNTAQSAVSSQPADPQLHIMHVATFQPPSTLFGGAMMECQATDSIGCCQKLTLRACPCFYVFGMYC
ncbi:TPA: hypothetical protein ACH3X2_012493 [Trebouxia sp. C0005]